MLDMDNRELIGAYLDESYQQRLQLVGDRTKKGTQDLLAEALNDLFRKYQVTVVGEGDGL